MRRISSPASLRPVLAFAGALCSLAAASCGSSSAIETGDAGVADASIDQPSAADDASTPSTLGPGATCAAPGDCASGFCVDGVCCESACTQACFSCALPGSAGSCVPAEVGSDPREDCPDEGQSSCGRDGQCDGSGACRHYPVGVICRAQSCSGSTRTNAFRCDGASACRPTSGQPCDPYVCDGGGTDCLVACATNADCLGGAFCNNGSCGMKPLGAACALDDECNSAICQQGVCCGSLCAGTCQSCAVPGSAGTCTDVPAGQDPLDHCADSGQSSCGSDGSCDGQGACRLYSAGAVCQDPACVGTTGTPQGRCDGLGVCAVGPGVSCGTCEACTLTATAALCSPVPAGVAPVVAGQCVNQGAASCGDDGTCNGLRGCRQFPSGTVCVAGSCPTGATQLTPRLCNGAGVCQVATSAACPGAFLCDAASGACKTTCTVATSSTDCAAPSVCTGTVCGTLELQYEAGLATNAATTTSPHPWFRIINLGPADIALSDLTMRYWYTADGAQGQVATVDFASNSNNTQIQGNCTSLFTAVTRTNANFFLQLGFTAAAGVVAKGGGNAVVQTHFNSAGFVTTYTQTGDYSFDPSKTAFADWTRVTLYQRGVLVWGIEPAPL